MRAEARPAIQGLTRNVRANREVLRSALAPDEGNLSQDIAYDTSRIRQELGYGEEFDEQTAMINTARLAPSGA